MAGIVRPRALSEKWQTRTFTMTGSAIQITPTTAMDRIVTIMIQAKSTNSSSVYFGEDSGVSSSDAGGELTSGMSAVLPMNDTETDSTLYVIGTSGDIIYASFFDGGNFTSC